MDRPWWAMPSGRQRRAAKAAYYACRPELPDVPKGHAPKEIEVEGKRGFVGPAGFFWPYNGDLEKRAARLAAQTELRPSPLIQVVEDSGVVHFVGRSGWRYDANLDTARLFKVFYGAAVQAETIVAARAANQPAAGEQAAGQP